MSTLYENLITGDDNVAYASSTRYDAQTFTVGAVGHTVTSVKLLIYRDVGYSTTSTVAIYGVDGSDLPDDANILATSDAVAAAFIGTDPAGTWVEFTFSSPPKLIPNTKYAVVLIPTAENLQWRYDSDNGYANGVFALRNAGTWGEYVGDGLFEIWGDVSDILLYEYNNGVNNYYEIYGSWAGAQSFTPQISHDLTEVSLYGYRVGSPGDVTAEIYLSDTGGNDDKPVGDVLATATFNGNNISTSAGWIYGIEFLSPASLVAGTKYVLVIKASAGDASNKLWWGYSTANPYADGKRSYSPDGGANWYPQDLHDHTFREYGLTNVAPEITEQDPEEDITVGSGEEVILSVTATGIPDPTYQWYKNDVIMSGETSDEWTIYPTSTATYKCIVTNIAGSDTSDPIIVTVVSNPYVWNPFDIPLDVSRTD